jgi:hypothetical protein
MYDFLSFMRYYAAHLIAKKLQEVVEYILANVLSTIIF